MLCRFVYITHSSGDRTIQMSTTEDNIFPNSHISQMYLDYSDSKSTFGIRYCSVHGFAVDATSKHSKSMPIAIVDSELTGICPVHTSTCGADAD
jgi:hypothetical protein